MANDPQNYLTIDVPCLGCGYNLRGLKPESVCPECGKSIRHSLQSNSLRYADPRWLRRLVRGMDLVLAAALSTEVCGILNATVIAIWQNAPFPLPIACALIVFSAGLLCLFGVLDLTSPDPGQVNEPSFSARRLMRILACTTFAMGGTWLLIKLLATPIPMLAVGGRGSVAIAGSLGLWATACYAVQLGHRLPDKRLAEHLKPLPRRTVAAVASILLLLGMVLLLKTVTINAGAKDVLTGFTLIVFVAAGIVSPVTAWGFVAVFFRFRKLLRLALAQAKKASGQ